MHGFLGIFFEGAVADQLRVETAIVGVVDFFGHQAIEHGANVSGNLIGFDLEDHGVGALAVQNGQCTRQQGATCNRFHQYGLRIDIP
jgi:hypothetical protein